MIVDMNQTAPLPLAARYDACIAGGGVAGIVLAFKGQGVAGNHHMGTTRMGISTQDGVVDANCRVFGVGNLYIAGSSVFPTVGHANPTLTIVQLTLRLADHLAQG